MVTFYQFVRDALLILQGERDVAPLPTFKVPLVRTDQESCPGAPNSSAASSPPTATAAGRVRTTGDQGSGILSSMSQANCFIVLDSDTGNVAAGESVDVQLLEGLV